jgi:sugar phosphate isomerase/epimerase
MYSFSTCWNSHRHNDGREMLREIRSLGFDFAELSHGIRLSLLPGILQAVDSGEIKISTLHNFCPLPMGVERPAPNLYLFSSEDSRERDNAFRHTIKTLDTAQRLKAEVVVLHTGRIEMRNYTEKLMELIAKGQRESDRYAALCEELLERREQKKERYIENAYQMLDRLSKEAEARGLKLGIENRDKLEEIPIDTEFSFLFRRLNRPNVGYWHDTGHAQIKENLGFIHHVIHLECLAERLFGFHVHDVDYPGRDHAAPGSGTIDFAALKPVIKPAHIKVFELSPHLTRDAVEKGIAHIKQVWGPE